MSRIVSYVVSGCLAVAVHAILVAPAFAQDPPATDPSTAPPPVAHQTAASAASVFDQPGFDFGARLGYALPFGNTSGEDKLSDGISGAVPFVLEAGYRVNASFTIGALFQYGVAQVKDGDTTGCGGGVSCSGSVMRLGIEGIYNLNLGTTMAPWVGLGTGYEWFSLSASAGGQSATVSAKGFEFVSLHAGGDFSLAPNFALGPFVSLSLAQYASASVEGAGINMSMDLTDKKMHEWLQLGVRGRFGI